MSALGDAIARARPADSLAARSPLAGLRRRSVGTVDLVAQSVAAVAPAGVLLTHPRGILASVGAYAPAEFLATAVLVVLVAAAMAIFARRLASTGSLYTFVVRALGPALGMATGIALLLGYAGIAMMALRSAARGLVALLPPGARPDATPWVIAVALLLAAAILIALLRSARATTRVLLVTELVAVVVVVVLSCAMLFVAAIGGGGAPVPAASPPSLGDLVTAIGFTFAAFVGFESGIALGPESRRPLVTVPRALMWTTIAVGVIYLIGMLAQFAAATMGSADGTAMEGARWLGMAGRLIVAASFAACALAMATAAGRLIFAMSREKALPHMLGSTVARSGTPAAASALAILVIGGGAALLELTARVPGVVGAVMQLGTTSFLVAYLLVCIAAPVYLARIGEMTFRESWPALAAAACLTVLVVARALTTEGPALAALAVGAVAVALLSAAHARRVARDPALRARAGAYDAPTSSEGLASAPVAGSR